VRNRSDGRVEALIEGPAELVEEMVGWCHDGPPSASVADVVVTPEQVDETLSSFHVPSSA
jgi:acylphosphatase